MIIDPRLLNCIYSCVNLDDKQRRQPVDWKFDFAKDRGLSGVLAIYLPSIVNDLGYLVFLLDNSIFSRSIGISSELLLLLTMLCCANLWDID